MKTTAVIKEQLEQIGIGEIFIFQPDNQNAEGNIYNDFNKLYDNLIKNNLVSTIYIDAIGQDRILNIDLKSKDDKDNFIIYDFTNVKIIGLRRNQTINFINENYISVFPFFTDQVNYQFKNLLNPVCTINKTNYPFNDISFRDSNFTNLGTEPFFKIENSSTIRFLFETSVVNSGSSETFEIDLSCTLNVESRTSIFLFSNSVKGDGNLLMTANNLACVIIPPQTNLTNPFTSAGSWQVNAFIEFTEGDDFSALEAPTKFILRKNVVGQPLAPTPTDDSSKNFQEWSKWETIANKIYFCTDPTINSANWELIN